MSILVVDTNVLLADPNSLVALAERGKVVVPIGVVGELDKHKTSNGEVGRNARAASRLIEALYDENKVGVAPNVKSIAVVDDEIVECAMVRGAIVVSNDTQVRIKARALGCQVEEWETTKRTDVDPDLSGVLDVGVEPGVIDTFYKEHGVELSFKDGVEPHPNEFLVMTCGSQSAIARWMGDGTARPLATVGRDGVFGIHPRSKEQQFAIDLLMDDNVKLVCLMGQAGTGKTLLAIAAGLHKAVEEGVYDKVLVSRPVMPLGGQDIGYLPGTIEEKMAPWMAPINDSIEFLLDMNGDGKKRGRSASELAMLDMVKVEPLTYIRGRSIPRQYMIIDEAQNLTTHELKTIISRAGEGTKIVLTGDPEQIDHPKLNSMDNGLSATARAFAAQRIEGHITLTKGERSELARLAAELM